MQGLEIKRIPREELIDRVTIFSYESDSYYRVTINEKNDGWSIDLKRKEFPQTFIKNDSTDKLVHDFKGDSEIYLAYLDGKEAGQLQIEFQEYNKSIRVWDIDIWPGYRRKGIGKALMDLCKKRAVDINARRIVLEVQSSNSKAIEFYLAMGFKLIGLDGSHYCNDDMDRGEVRLEMAIHL